MAGPQPIPMPMQMPGNLPPHPGNQQMHGLPGHPAHGQMPHAHGPNSPVIALPYFIGFELIPITLPDGSQTFENVRPQQMLRSQLELAQMVEERNTKVKDVLRKLPSGEKRRAIDRILEDHKRMERDFNMEWKFAYIKLAKKDLLSGIAKLAVNATVVTGITVILKKVLRSESKAARRQSVPLPFNQDRFNVNVHQHPPPPPMGGFPPQNFPQMHGQQMPPQGHLNPQGRMPPPPIHTGGQRPPMMPMRQSRVAEVVSDDEDDWRDNKKGGGKKKDKRDSFRNRSESPDIRVPDFRDRRSSRTSSRPTSRSYDSDVLSPLESPGTSYSGFSGHWPDTKRYSGSSKKHQRNKDSRSSKRGRRGSVGSNDSFVFVSRDPFRNKYGGSSSSHRSHSIEEYSQGGSPDRRQRRRRDSERRDDIDHRELIRDMDRMRITQLERKAEDKREIEHQLEMNSRINRLEIISSDSHNRFGRPVRERSYSDRQGSLGYLPRSRHDERFMSLR